MTDRYEGISAAPSAEERRKKTAALVAVGAAFGGTVALVVPFVLTQLRSPLPFMSTPAGKVSRALEEIARRRGLVMAGGGFGGGGGSGVKTSASSTLRTTATATATTRRRPLRFTDLGSGDGTAVLAAASSPHWTSTGIELNSTLFLVSSLRRLFSPSEVRRRSRFVWGDMWKADLRGEDAIMIFGVKPLMPMVAEKVGRECVGGTYVMSYRFRVPLVEEEDEEEKASGAQDDARGFEDNGGRLHAKLVYDEEEMRVYEVLGDRKEGDGGNHAK